VEASIITKDKQTIIIAATNVPEANTGSDWPNSLVVVEFTSAVTDLITRTGPAQLEIQVNCSGKLTWFVSIDIEKGTIS